MAKKSKYLPCMHEKDVTPVIIAVILQIPYSKTKLPGIIFPDSF